MTTMCALEGDAPSLRRQDLLCLSFYYLGFSQIRNLILRFRGIPVTRILAFHDVPDQLMKDFRTKIEVLKEQVNVISLDEFFAGKTSCRKINVAVTFDDGYRGWVDNVRPVLKDLRVPATFFTSSGFVGLGRKEGADFVQKNLKSDQRTTGSLPADGLRRLVEEGFTIGGHTSSHSNLTVVCDIHEVRREIQKDKQELERMAGTRVEYFAYPFGIHRNSHIDLVQVLQESGYRGAVTIVPGCNTPRTNRFFLRRDLVDASLPLSVFKARFLGNHDAVILVREILRRRANRC